MAIKVEPINDGGLAKKHESRSQMATSGPVKIAIVLH